MLKVGDKMPAFEVQDQDWNVVKSEDFIGNGRKTIIYFYPKDNTSGCTAKFELPFRLLSDVSREMHEAFGAIGEKRMYGKTVQGTLRRTFIFSEDGTLERIIEKVDTKNAAGQIL